MRRTTSRPLVSLLLGLVLLAGVATPALAWSNGPDEGNGHGTHDYIIGQAIKVFDGSPPAWLDLDLALRASDDPDTQFFASGEHVFNEKGYGRGAVDRIVENYHLAFTAHAAGDDATASIAFGWLAHYYGDILQPYHTNHDAVDRKVSHHRYESLVGPMTRTADMSPAWITDDRTPDALTDIRTPAIAAAAYSRKFFPELYRLFHADETILTPRVMEITGLLLQRASSDLANVLYSIDQGVGQAPVAGSVTASLKTTYVARYSTQTIYVTVKDAAGRPLEGVRVDIAFPTATGGTTLLRRYTTAEGKVTAYGSVGKSPLGVRRDVKVTVKTADVTKVVTPWFVATRRLASGNAGFKSYVNAATVYPGQAVQVGSRARDAKGRGVANLKVTWKWTFADGTVLKTTGDTNADGRAYSTLGVTEATPKGKVSVRARTQAGGVYRISTTSFRIY